MCEKKLMYLLCIHKTFTIHQCPELPESTLQFTFCIDLIDFYGHTFAYFIDRFQWLSPIQKKKPIEWGSIIYQQ